MAQEFSYILEEDLVNTLSTGEHMVLCTVPWCPQNESILEIFSLLSARYAVYGVRFARVEVNEVPSLRSEYNVRSVPTIAVFIDGELREEFCGITEDDQVIPRMNELLGL